MEEGGKSGTRSVWGSLVFALWLCCGAAVWETSRDWTWADIFLAICDVGPFGTHKYPHRPVLSSSEPGRQQIFILTGGAGGFPEVWGLSQMASLSLCLPGWCRALKTSTSSSMSEDVQHCLSPPKAFLSFSDTSSLSRVLVSNSQSMIHHPVHRNILL